MAIESNTVHERLGSVKRRVLVKRSHRRDWAEGKVVSIKETTAARGEDLMAKFKPGYYTADTVHGVQYKDWVLDPTDAEVILPLEFLDELPYVQEGQIIVTVLEPYHKDIFDEIKENYGIA